LVSMNINACWVFNHTSLSNSISTYHAWEQVLCASSAKIEAICWCDLQLNSVSLTQRQ
jgi:hypothetical protein